ncbi:hypothetical protein [Dyadobacter bucti]|uniref:hypothetical protein n=1 Tax=Dyadobacter bucti TaxID=2572203 RepID=UPI003F6EC3D0
MKTYLSLKSIPVYLAITMLLCACGPKSDVTPADTEDILGQWRLKTVKLDAKVKVNGQVQPVSDSAEGTADQIIEFKSDGTIADPSDIFGTSTYTWKYTVKGTELAIGEPDDIGYFALNSDAKTMKWQMDLARAQRSLKETEGFSSVFNVDAADMRDALVECNLALEFVKK